MGFEDEIEEYRQKLLDFWRTQYGADKFAKLSKWLTYDQAAWMLSLSKASRD